MKWVFMFCVLTVLFYSILNPFSSYAEDNDSLRSAIINGKIDEVKSFLGNGEDVNKVYDDGSTPLLEAIDKSYGSSAIVTLLLQYGANPKLKPSGYSPLSAAKKTNNEEIINLFRHSAEDDGEFYDLAIYYRDRKEDFKALECADNAVKLNPLNSDAWALKGSIYFLQKNIKESEFAYYNAFKAMQENLKTNQSAEGYTSAVWYALLSAHFSDASRIGKEGLSLYPESGPLEMNIGHALLFLGNKKDALAFYTKALDDFIQDHNDSAVQIFIEDFTLLEERYPDKTAHLEWARKRLFEPFDFEFGEMPFGEDKNMVLKSVAGADVKKDESALIGIEDPVLKKQFGKGLYSSDLKSRLSPMFVEKYSVTYDKWDTIDHIDLFFTAVPGTGDHGTLFLVSKFNKEQRGNIDALFISSQDAVSKELGIQPAVHNTQIMSQTGSISVPVKIAIWKLADSTVILDVVNVSSSLLQTRIIHVSTKGWNQYLNSLKVNNRNTE